MEISVPQAAYLLKKTRYTGPRLPCPKQEELMKKQTLLRVLCGLLSPALIGLSPLGLAESEVLAAKLPASVESLKQNVLDLNRDLLILEEDLLYPSSTQVVMFLSMDLGTFFTLDAVKVKIDDKLVASHLYTERNLDALFRGGIQKLYLGNISSGEHEISAFFTGRGPSGRDYKRAASLRIEKGQDPSILELKIVDSASKEQPNFEIKEWQP